MARQCHWHPRRYAAILLHLIVVISVQKPCISAIETTSSLTKKRRGERTDVRHAALVGRSITKFQTTAYIPPLLAPKKIPYIISSINGWLTTTAAGSLGILKETIVGEALGSVASHALDRSSFTEEKKNYNKGVQATEAMRFCYRACFASVTADLFSALMHVSKLSSRGGGKIITTLPSWSDVVDILSSLNLLSMGFGLKKVHGFVKHIVVSEEDMTCSQILQTASIMAKVWRNIALTIFAVSTALATTFQGEMVISSKWLLNAVISVALLGGIVIYKRSTNYVAQMLEEEDILHSNNNNSTCNKEGADDNTNIVDGHQSKARAICFIQSHNMALCTGSFFLTFIIRFLHWLRPPPTRSILERFFSVDDFITPLTLSIFLKSLYRKYLRVVVVATSGTHNFNSFKVEDEVYRTFFEAQISFYSNVGDTLASAVAFSLVPYLFGLVTKIKRWVWV